MDLRENRRIQCAVDVEVTVGALVANGSLVDVSDSGVCVRYLDDEALRLAVAAPVVIRGVLSSGRFELSGHVVRVDASVGELGIAIDAGALASIRALLSAPIGGAG